MMKNSIIQFIKFGMVGGLNTILNYAIYYACVSLGTSYLFANALAWFITVNISYVLNNLFTFNGDEKPEWSFKALFKVYASYSVTGIFLNSLLLILWVDLLGIDQRIAAILNMPIAIPINFLLNKYWAYKK